MVCRISEEGWYEGIISGNGDYYLLYYDPNDSEESYKEFLSGNSEVIETGKGVNIVDLTCEGNELSLAVNDVNLGIVSLDEYSYPLLEWGGVGFAFGNAEETPASIEI